MNLILTNFGLRFAVEHSKSEFRQSKLPSEPDVGLLDQLRRDILIPYRTQPQEDLLIARGMATIVSESLSREEIVLRYQRNPLEHIRQVAIEFTTLCNMNCRHCYNATVPRVTEQNIGALKSAVDIFLAMGIERFDFIGGEVSKYGTRWQEVVQYIRRNSSAAVTLFTSGWWIGQKGFRAAGRVYSGSKEYLTELRRSGLTHIIFSLDGLRSKHDRSRGCPGLFERVLSEFDEVMDAGLQPRVALLMSINSGIAEYTELLSLISHRMDRCASGRDSRAHDDALVSDPVAVCSNLIDIGNQAKVKKSGIIFLPDVPDDILFCKGFYRPSPMLTIKANGEVATCRLVNAGEGYGNIHTSGLLHTLNHLQDSFVFQLHAQHKLGEYREFMDFELFGKYYDHICTPRAILTLLARKIHETGMNTINKEVLRRINLEVSQATGHRPK